MRRAAGEEGFAVIAAVVLLTVIMGLGLGLLLFSDSQQKAATHEQASEAAFNVAEAALNAQIGQLAHEWPTVEKPIMPERCTASTTETNGCPSAADLKLDPNTGSTTCSGTDAWGSPMSNQWTTYVRQDLNESGPFSSTEEKKAPLYAASETGALWVRAVGVVQCHAVTVISLVTRLRVELEFPKDAIAGNWFEVTNSGNKVIVNRQGYAAQPGPVSMRCESPPAKGCEVYQPEEKNKVSQVSPSITEDPKNPAATLTSAQLATLKAEAQAYGTFYSSGKCPTSMTELEGKSLSKSSRAPVYIEGCGALTISANGEANCQEKEGKGPESPGFLVLANGTLTLSGTSKYCGVIYAPNLENLKTAVVKLQGNTVVVGGIEVDGPGGIEFGSSGEKGGSAANLVFDPFAVDNLTISAGAASTRNSFRILPAGQ